MRRTETAPQPQTFDLHFPPPRSPAPSHSPLTLVISIFIIHFISLPRHRCSREFDLRAEKKGRAESEERRELRVGELEEGRDDTTVRSVTTVAIQPPVHLSLGAINHHGHCQPSFTMIPGDVYPTSGEKIQFPASLPHFHLYLHSTRFLSLPLKHHHHHLLPLLLSVRIHSFNTPTSYPLLPSPYHLYLLFLSFLLFSNSISGFIEFNWPLVLSL